MVRVLSFWLLSCMQEKPNRYDLLVNLISSLTIVFPNLLTFVLGHPVVDWQVAKSFILNTDFRPFADYYSLLNTYFMKTYVLLHFEHKNDVTVIIKLLYRGTSRRRVAL